MSNKGLDSNKLAKIIAWLINKEFTKLQRNPWDVAEPIVARLVHLYDFSWSGFEPNPDKPNHDWTTARGGRKNSSPHFNKCVNKVGQVLNNNLTALIKSENAANAVAEEILSTLINDCDLVPPWSQETLTD